MNKQDLLKIQSCVLKVNIHCDGCEQKVKKLLQKIDGVYSVNIDAEQGKVVVSGNVDPAKLIKKLKSSGKHAELWGGQRGMMNMNMMFPTNQFKNMQIDHHHGKGGKPHKGGGGKDQQKGGGQPHHPQLPHLQNKGGSKDLKLPSKDHKSVKFQLPPEDDEFDGSDDSFDEFDDDDDDEEEFGHGNGHGHGGHAHAHAMPKKMMPMAGMMNGRGPPMNNSNKGKGGGGGAKKDDVMDLIMQLKGKGENNEFKNGDGGKKNNGDGGKKNKGGGGNKKNNSKSSSGGLLGRFLGFGQKSNKGEGGGDKNKNKNKGGGGGGGGNNKGKEGKKGGGKFDGQDVNKMDDYDYEEEEDDDDYDEDLDELDIPQGYDHGKGGKGNNGNVGHKGPNPMGQMGPMEQMRNIAAVQGLPAMNGGYYHQGQGMQMQPPALPQYNPQQQQYMAMMMNHNQQMMQQQQPHMNNMYPQMMYGRPYMPPPPPIPVHPMGDHYFSDENTESCTVM